MNVKKRLLDAARMNRAIGAWPSKSWSETAARKT